MRILTNSASGVSLLPPRLLASGAALTDIGVLNTTVNEAKAPLAAFDSLP
jgi:hypothetical protein